jgi:hippurate hydrolase
MRLSAAEVRDAIGWRRHIHAHPELAYEEFATARMIADLLRGWGYEVTENVGGTGVVATLRRGTSRRSVALRADMDALPIHEATGLPYASTIRGKMHACGHDGHTAILLAAARGIARDLDFDGRLHLIFQPAEEGAGGAAAMIADGLFERFPADAVFALHNWPSLDAGRVVAHEGPIMAAMATFDITVRGRGGHAAMPETTRDPIVAGAQLVGALQSFVSRRVPAVSAAVLSVTQIHAGDAYNVIPECCVLKGTARWFERSLGIEIESFIRSSAVQIAAAFGCDAAIRYDELYPPTVNATDESQFVRSLITPPLSLSLVVSPPSMAAEDFAFMLQRKPGCYFWLGARQGVESPALHSPHFDFNDEILQTGANLWIELVDRYLELPCGTRPSTQS